MEKLVGRMREHRLLRPTGCHTKLMDKKMIRVPISYVSSITKLSNSCVIYAYQRNYISWQECIQAMVINNPNSEIEEFFRGVGKDNLFLISDSIEKFSINICEHSEKKWMLILLHWVFDNRHVINDPLGLVECIYSEFNYPEEIEGFVRCMPVKDNYDPDAHTSLENEERLFKFFNQFLEKNFCEVNCKLCEPVTQHLAVTSE